MTNKVVEMPDKSLASLLELAKKWLVEWSIDHKKLLYVLLHLRKEDVIGLVEGTHEIKHMGDDAYFECVLETDYITVPDLESVIAHVEKKWGEEKLGNMKPPSFLVGNVKKKVKVFRLKREVPVLRLNDLMRSQKNAFSNVFTLAIADMTVQSQLPTDAICGIFHGESHLVSTMHRYLDGKIDYDWMSNHGRTEKGMHILMICD